ncbi:MAG: D-sedoheptulose 7-phosphate isomerase [Bacteroidales bacterium]|nr:D-sedoheptulose 7-phosphate isomerase [Bacteroidales bacterium]MBN2762592.1 D-sedoheptulose 7-phosphate isomerase [Bacteroidales bacterium]
MSFIKQQFIEAKELLDAFLSDDHNFMLIEQAGNIMAEAIRNQHKIISCGNGGSMCDAMHFAEELSGVFRENRHPLPAIAISDPSYLTCTGNDYGFESVFSRFVEAVGKQGDVLLTISTSGNSINVIKAAQVAKNKGIKVVGLTGKTGGKLAELCDVEIRAPHSAYSDRIQELHIKIIHSLILTVEHKLSAQQ